jgi:hypothetical protein
MGLPHEGRRARFLPLWALAVACFSLNALGMEVVKLSGDKQGFVLSPSGDGFIPWGHNYAAVDLLDRLGSDPLRVEREFAEMKAAGTTVARVHPEMPRILLGPRKADPLALERVGALLRIAERAGIRLMITGLACYRIDDRLKTQCFFWETIARTCAGSPAVFAYDLVNEPAATGAPPDSWYMGRLGEAEFCQRLSLDRARGTGEEVFREWTALMVAAIRAHDSERLITMGMLPFPDAYKAAAEKLDFVSPHLYPKTGKVEDEIALLQRFAWGKPIVIGETFPLSCSADDERTFLLGSRPWARGWVGHWPDKSPEKLAGLKADGRATIHDLIWLSWVELFQELGGRMTGNGSP